MSRYRCLERFFFWFGDLVEKPSHLYFTYAMFPTAHTVLCFWSVRTGLYAHVGQIVCAFVHVIHVTRQLLCNMRKRFTCAHRLKVLLLWSACHIMFAPRFTSVSRYMYILYYTHMYIHTYVLARNMMWRCSLLYLYIYFACVSCSVLFGRTRLERATSLHNVIHASLAKHARRVRNTRAPNINANNSVMTFLFVSCKRTQWTDTNFVVADVVVVFAIASEPHTQTHKTHRHT